ncbi:MAG: hypothetical protein AAFO03_02645 [Bacteroidota bacterium]
MKKLLLAAFLISLMGTGLELLLLEHFEGFWQIIPLVLMGLGLLCLAWFAIGKSSPSRQVFRGLMLLFMISGVLGFALHYNGNMAFELEMYPSMQGAELAWETLKGATPVLAPGTMIATALLGWAFTMTWPVQEQ